MVRKRIPAMKVRKESHNSMKLDQKLKDKGENFEVKEPHSEVKEKFRA